MKRIIELAIKGASIEEVAKNIAAMNPSLLLAERIVSGIPTVTKEDLTIYLQRHYKKVDIKQMSIECGFNEDCLHVSYEYTVEGFANNKIDKVLTYDEYYALKRNGDVRDSKSETHQYPVEYMNTNWDRVAPEKVIEYVRNR